MASSVNQHLSVCSTIHANVNTFRLRRIGHGVTFVLWLDAARWQSIKVWETNNKQRFLLKWRLFLNVHLPCRGFFAVHWSEQLQMFYACGAPPTSFESDITQSTCVCSPSRPDFLLLWLTAEDTCGGTLRGSNGLISSFDFPHGDSPSTGGGGGTGGLGSSGECKWTILADPGDTISLVFTEFQMEEKSDYLEVEGSEPPTIWWVDLSGGWGALALQRSGDAYCVVQCMRCVCLMFREGVHWKLDLKRH